MSIIDVNAVINGTDAKIILNGYDKLKENYTKEGALNFLQVYKDMPLSSIFESSRYIFSEPYEGLSFYENLINENACTFTKLNDEYNKVVEFINEHADMPDEQKEIYTNFVNRFKAILEHTKNTRIYANYIKENISEDFEDKLSEAIKSNNTEKISDLFESVDPIAYITYAPYVLESLNDDGVFNEVGISIMESLTPLYDALSITQESNDKALKLFTECVLCANKLSCDESYKVNPNANRDFKDVISYMESIDLTNIFNDYSTVTVKEEDVILKESVNAVNSLFDDINENLLFKENEIKFNNYSDNFKAIILESALDIMVEEYRTSNDTNEKLTSYKGIVEDGLTIEEGYKKILSTYNDICPNLVTEADDEDVSDDEIDAVDNDELTVDKSDNESTGKKIKAPEPKNKAIATTTKYMDKEAQQFKKRADRKQKGQEKKNAIKAVVALPLNVLKDIQKQVKMIDKADDERRKNYMTEPGFRKKAFRNLKLAILYGSVANMNLAMIPVVVSCRHFSKTKDIRIRNELVRELDTEIKVTEEKINDASANGDLKEKYKLMRIRDQLNNEMVRVRLNSKYM